MSAHMSAHMSTCMPAHMSAHMSTYMSAHTSTPMSTHMSTHMSTYMPTLMSTHMSTHMSARMSTHIFPCPDYRCLRQVVGSRLCFACCPRLGNTEPRSGRLMFNKQPGGPLSPHRLTLRVPRSDDVDVDPSLIAANDDGHFGVDATTADDGMADSGSASATADGQSAGGFTTVGHARVCRCAAQCWSGMDVCSLVSRLTGRTKTKALLTGRTKALVTGRTKALLRQRTRWDGVLLVYTQCLCTCLCTCLHKCLCTCPYSYVATYEYGACAAASR